jgi:DNA-binding transcriptional ArsR family regulator
MEDVFFFENIEQIQATADPIRWKILNLLIGQPMTGSQLARALGIRGPLAHYHLKTLEKANLVEFTEERPLGGVVERYYRAIAREFRTDHLVDRYRISEDTHDNGNLAGEVVRNIMLAMLEIARIDLAHPELLSLFAKSGFNFQDEVVLNQAQTNEFIRSLRQIAERFQQISAENRQLIAQGNPESYNEIRFTWLLTPVAPIPANEIQEEFPIKKRGRKKKTDA